MVGSSCFEYWTSTPCRYINSALEIDQFSLVGEQQGVAKFYYAGNLFDVFGKSCRFVSAMANGATFISETAVALALILITVVGKTIAGILILCEKFRGGEVERFYYNKNYSSFSHLGNAVAYFIAANIDLASVILTPSLNGYNKSIKMGLGILKAEPSSNQTTETLNTAEKVKKVSVIEEERPEIKKIKEKAKTVCKWAPPPNPTVESGSNPQAYGRTRIACKYTRFVYMGSNNEESPTLYLKIRPGNHVNRGFSPQNEELAHRVSTLFNLHVVPNTVCIQDGGSTLKEISENGKRKNLEFINAFAHLPLILQEAVPSVEQVVNEKVDQAQIQKAVLFNLLLGRDDARKDNSVFDKEGKIYEIDNEDLGVESESWLFEEYATLAIDSEIKSLVLSWDEKILEKEFADLEKYHKFDPDLKKAIKDNLKKLKEFLSTNSSLTVKALKEKLYEIKKIEK